MLLRLTITPSVSSVGTLYALNAANMQELAAYLESHVFIGEKQDAWLLCGAATWTKFYRERASIGSMGKVLVCDVDGVTDQQMQQLGESLDGVSYIAYTSHSHRTERKQGKNTC